MLYDDDVTMNQKHKNLLINLYIHLKRFAMTTLRLLESLTRKSFSFRMSLVRGYS